MSATVEKTVDSGKVTCQICGELTHIVIGHVAKSHPEYIQSIVDEIGEAEEGKEKQHRSILFSAIEEKYTTEFSLAEIYSEAAKKAIESKNSHKKESQGAKTSKSTVDLNEYYELKPIDEVFNILSSPKTRDISGNTIMVQCMKAHNYQYLVPEKKSQYVWDIDTLKIIIMGVELKIPSFLWGFAGVGKSSGFTQYCASTNRPMIRVQHTGDTESSHIIGQTLANEKGTFFNPGPLAEAMRKGWFFLADEYDFAFPQVTSVYQPVLEGEQLYIKEADEEWKVVEPHPCFYMAATGNTNGAGDETGLFQGVNMQNAANFERFGIVHKVDFMEKRKEIEMLSRTFDVDKKHVEPVVEFVTAIRRARNDGKMSNVAGQRVSLRMVEIYINTGDYMKSCELSFLNRLPESDRSIAEQIAQRFFG